MSEKGIDYFNRGHWLTSLQEKISIRARRRMYDLWSVQGIQRVLDVGTTPDLERIDSNCFIGWLVADNHEVAALSPEDVSSIRSKFPGVQVLPVFQGQNWNLKEKSYHWVFSSAVIEHVGSHEEQKIFLRNCAHVADGIFLTTPNRWHWLEFHTKIPLIHWLPKPLHRRILKLLGKDFWGSEKNLNLMTRKELIKLAGEILRDEFYFEVKSVWTLGMPSNLILLARRKS